MAIQNTSEGLKDVCIMHSTAILRGRALFRYKKPGIRIHVINIYDPRYQDLWGQHGANMGPTWVLSAPDGPHVGPMNFAIRDGPL